MDDYNISTIIDSKNEWSARLTNILNPCIIDGITSIFDEAYKMCIDNDEESKYLMTFQNLLNNIPKWSSQIVETEKDRIVSNSCCNYLDDLLTCVHITQLKSLTSTRVGIKQKKVNIDIPDLNTFIHKVYINVARKIYVNVYLFEKNIMPLQIQKNNRELEIIVTECILNTIRNNIPVENILKIYLDNTQETDVEVTETKEKIPDKEAIEKMEKEAKEKELADIKKEIKAKLEKESKDNLSNTLINANKSLNKDTSNIEKNRDLDSASELDSDYVSEDDSIYSKDKLELDNLKNISDTELNIKELDKDPDKFELESLDLKDITSDDNIELDIQEL